MNISGYKSYHLDTDVATYVRDDVKVITSNKIPGLVIPHIRVKVKGIKTLDIINIYTRDKTLTPQILHTLENKYKTAIILGDFNAKHHDILPHSQTSAYNANGKTLYQHLIRARDSGISTLHLHNPRTSTEWTHAINGRWCQIDLIFNTPTAREHTRAFTFKDSLLSDHKVIGIHVPGVFNNIHRKATNAPIIKWSTFNPYLYQTLTEAELTSALISGAWGDATSEGKVLLLMTIQQKYFKASVQHKSRGKKQHNSTLPRWLVNNIKNRRHKIHTIKK